MGEFFNKIYSALSGGIFGTSINVFDIIDALPPGAGGEIQLTDAMAIMARTKGITALEFEGDRYDMGSKLGFLKANVVKGLSHKETAEDFREFIKEIAKTL